MKPTLRIKQLAVLLLAACLSITNLAHSAAPTVGREVSAASHGYNHNAVMSEDSKELLGLPNETPVFSNGFEQTFRDCPNCPLMANIPGGTFEMGDINGTGSPDELPVHPVTVPAFAIGVYEVTFDEWDACVAAGGCGGYSPSDEGWGRGTRPVINVSWDDAQAYIAWLNSTTGGGYRLPSESEWEYAARAGTTTEYWWGDEIGVNNANCYPGYCGDSFPNTAPAGSFAVNPFGLFDVHGNAFEWVEDCWNSNYDGAPLDGSPWLTGDCFPRVHRGGSWYSGTNFLRSATRNRYSTTFRRNDYGFRVAQDQN